ncbi:MAG: Glucitol operon repressor [Lentisphaerae bacterium ADurb.Bin242]|nr:MAG: Glucitol operon repressor [Lentisphaerae bacterium ADurb.Bin242]
MRDRQRKILEMLRRGKIFIKETAFELGVTEMTLRRDLRALEERKLLIQIKGGAISSPIRYETDTGNRLLNDLKFMIAEALYKRIMPSETLFIGAGSTALAFARVLARKKLPALTVVTNALPVASTLFQSSCKVILLGGELRTNSLDLVGPMAERNLEEYHVDWLVSGCDGALAGNGFYTSDMSLSNLEKRSISIASHVAVITESGKFGKKALTCFASVNAVDLLVTDYGLPAGEAALLKKAGMEVILVRPPEKGKEG